MGRYYYGDIQGKFMFAVQPSNAHERFGAVEYEPNYISYTIDRDKYDHIVKELNSIDRGSIDRVKFPLPSELESATTICNLCVEPLPICI